MKGGKWGSVVYQGGAASLKVGTHRSVEVNTPPTVSPEAWRPPLPTNTGDLEPDPRGPTLDRPKSAPRGVCQGVRASM